MPAFASGGFIPEARRGIKLDGLQTTWDMYATFGVIAGLSAEEAVADDLATAAGLPAVDSINQLGWWLGQETIPPRQELLVGGAVGNENGGGDKFFLTGVEAIIQAPANDTAPKWKMMIGGFHEVCALLLFVLRSDTQDQRCRYNAR